MPTVAHLADMKFIMDLSKKYKESIGFLPPPALMKYISARCCMIEEDNDQEAGFLLYQPTKRFDPRTAGIIQAAVCMDLQRRKHGLKMVRTAETNCRNAGASLIEAWVARDIEAFGFWEAAGYIQVTTRPGGTARNRPVTLFRKALRPEADLYNLRHDPRHGPGGRFITPAHSHDTPPLWPDHRPTLEADHNWRWN